MHCNNIHSLRTLFLGVIIVLLSADIAHVADDFHKDPELDRAMAGIFGDFDYDTGTVDDCRVPLSGFNEAISKGTFERSRDYLAFAYLHQSALLWCVGQDSAITDGERLEIVNAAFSSSTSAQQLAPNWHAPYCLLGEYYKFVGDIRVSVEDYRKAENYFTKALQLDPGNNQYQAELDEVRQLIPVKRAPGFKPIPFE